jgi:hypothetical protein
MGLGYAILVLTIYVLAVARVTRLINYDAVLDRPRAAVVRFVRGNPTVVYFLTCPWCVGMWVALASAVLPVRLIGWPWWALLPVALACSHLVGLAAPLSADDDIEIEDDVAAHA